MLYPFTYSLLDLCSIRIAYLMWTRQNVTKKGFKEEIFDELVDFVLADVRKLPLPFQLKSRILHNVKPAGKRLLRFLDLWRQKTQPRYYRENGLTGEMLFYCLILNADGMINLRKTAEKILSSRMLFKYSPLFAFRLACVNFLEKEVLMLWILVKQKLLHKISMEGCDPIRYSRLSYRGILQREHASSKGCLEFPRFPCTTEADEVMFWIGVCLSKENTSDLKEVPHFTGEDVDWYEFALESSILSCNVAGLDYFRNFSKRKVEYCNVEIFERNLGPDLKYYEQQSFMSYLMLLDSQAKADLLRRRTDRTVYHFLQWPLSQAFVENTEQIWNLIRDEFKEWTLLKIFAILFHENPLLNPITDCEGFCCGPLGFNSVIHSIEHVRRIWINLWEIISDSYKLVVLNSIVFKSIVHTKRFRQFRSNFKTSGLKEKLLHLFLSNGEAVLELYQEETMKRSLRRLIAKYMPEDFEDLDRRCIAFLKTQTRRYRRKMKIEMEEKVYVQNNLFYMDFGKLYPVHENFLSYIKEQI
ncbi:unnamed protein product [Larinioides sclopetarius]|uniref:Uncharacterized protein n=1 Tax=Larinioides sclopetarius TaxID=280406 RepID=A0AAV2BEY5_9ARAC